MTEDSDGSAKRDVDGDRNGDADGDKNMGLGKRQYDAVGDSNVIGVELNFDETSIVNIITPSDMTEGNLGKGE